PSTTCLMAEIGQVQWYNQAEPCLMIRIYDPTALCGCVEDSWSWKNTPVDTRNHKESDVKLKIKAGLLSSIACLGTVAMLSSASAAGFSELDANADGQLDLAELEASFGANAQSTLEAYDSDG